MAAGIRIPALPPRGTEVEEAKRLARQTLRGITDQVADNRLQAHVAREVVLQFIRAFFRKFGLSNTYSVDTTARDYLEVIDNHEQCLNNAAQQGRERLDRFHKHPITKEEGRIRGPQRDQPTLLERLGSPVATEMPAGVDTRKRTLQERLEGEMPDEEEKNHPMKRAMTVGKSPMPSSEAS
ncbi:hypothetical protein BT96DRAFT_943632 [Gymnopus androsaceus JB14]|uniref:Uncharacterized protein n=1 Tax=Gymnopus androsaceus JB14 TaxID=1447944 RepID=A0A6A4H7P7_9AGAR|nr:hypothetical protein BT96DRAFT_943632 [Gymnopus androsaceus JB14]